jgi:hypothetical protein
VYRGRTQGDGVWELGAEGGIWVPEGEVTGDWRKIHSEELRNLHAASDNCLGDNIKTKEMRCACSKWGKKELLQCFDGKI